MFNDIEGTVKRAVQGEIDSGKLQQAAQQHVQSSDQQTVKSNMQTAANNAQQSGNTQLADQIKSMLERDKDKPDALKQDLVTLVKEHPEILQHVEQTFAKDLLSKI